MKPILIFAIAAVVAAAVGVGSLNNTITLLVQQFGVGSADIQSPITNAAVDFTIEAIPSQDGTELKNVITACSFHSDEDVELGSKIICKLTDVNHKVIAEGTLTLVQPYVASTTVHVPITITAFPNANAVVNVKDVTLIVIGPEPKVPPPQGP
jgi:hypothetical protein